MANPTPNDLRALFEGGRVTLPQVLADVPDLLMQRAAAHRGIADGLEAAADLVRGAGPPEERLMGAALQTTIALRSGPSADVGTLLDLLLVLLQNVGGPVESG